jgi:hypothetical protein
MISERLWMKAEDGSFVAEANQESGKPLTGG